MCAKFQLNWINIEGVIAILILVCKLPVSKIDFYKIGHNFRTAGARTLKFSGCDQLKVPHICAKFHQNLRTPLIPLYMEAF